MSQIVTNALNATMPVAQLAELFRRSTNRLPSSSDGLTDAQAAPNVEGRVDKEAWLLRTVKGLSAQVKRGNPLPPSALPAILDAIMHAKVEGLDDRKLILEHILTLLSRLPPPVHGTREWSLQNEIQDAVIGLFYDALPHPPTTFAPSMMLELKVPTYLGDKRVGPGGTLGLSETGIGKAKIGCGFAGASSSSDAPTAPHPLPTPTLPPHGSSGANGSTKPGAPTPVLPQKPYNSAFRAPSGQGNNPHLPLLGAAGTAYARSVVPQHPIPQSALPDPSMVFDLLMRRREAPKGVRETLAQGIIPGTIGGVATASQGREAAARSSGLAGGGRGSAVDPKTVRLAAEFRGQGHGLPHPSGLSSLLFAFGDLIIHSLFRTSTTDPGVNLTSSYLDLSVLYGVDEAEMKNVRRGDGTGRLWEDCWADPRIAMMSPAVVAMLIIFCRNHNYVALRLLEINERKTYVPPAVAPTKSNNDTAEQLFPTLSRDEKELAAQDDDIFNRARLINCAYFMNAILGDYLAGILGTFRDASEWYLNPLEEVRKGGVTKVNRAEGNQVSVEFNLLYRWHSTITPQDEKWLEYAFKSNLPKDDPVQSMASGSVEIGKEAFIAAAREAGRKVKAEPKLWTFGTLERTTNGGFKDHELAKILHGATDAVACAYGARGIPVVMKGIEIMGIEQARKWGVCTMNEFRQFVGLKRYESFKEWNPTGDIAEVAEQLYQHIDNLELYVGLMCEESKQPGDGAGLCPGYTISRAILTDAVCLTRGDRFLTTDLNPANLTSWGYQDCARDGKNGSMGGNVCKLLFRNLPEYYPERSVYAHFPFVTPPEMKVWLTKMGLVDQYSFKPLPSDPVRPVVSINSAKGVTQVLKDMTTFNTVYSDGMKYLTNGYGFFLCFDDEVTHRLARTMISKSLYRPGAMDSYATFYRTTTRELIERRSFSSGSGKRAVNIVRDVINIVPVHWICEEIAGIPLKSWKAPRGVLTEQEVYGMIACMFTFIFLNIEPENSWPLRENSIKFAKTILEFIKGRLEKVSSEGSMFSALRGLRDSFLHYMTTEVDNSDAFYRSLLANNVSGMNLDQLSYNVLGTIVGSVANFAMATTLVVDFYLNEDRAAEKKEIMALSMDNEPKAALRLAGYAREALRLHPQAPGIFRKATADATIVEGNGRPPVNVQKGDRLFVSLAHANMDPEIFSNPEHLDPTRPKEAYSSFGHGEHTCLGAMFTDSMIPAVMRSIFSLPGVRRGPVYKGAAKSGPGLLNKFKHNIFGTETELYISNKGTVSPFPASLLIEYDA